MACDDGITQISVSSGAGAVGSAAPVVAVGAVFSTNGCSFLSIMGSNQGVTSLLCLRGEWDESNELS